MGGAKTIASYLEDLYIQSNSSSKWFAFVCILLASVYLVAYFRRRRRYNFPPGPTGLPLLGYLPFLGRVHHETLVNIAKKYGSVFSLYLGRSRVVFCNDWESMKDAMGQNATLGRAPEVFSILPSGLGFAGASGREWSEQRRFSVKIMRDIGLGRDKWEAMLQEDADELVIRLQEHGNAPVDVFEFVSSTFTNSILNLIFGDRLSIRHGTTTYVSKMVDVTMHEIDPLAVANFLPTLCKVMSVFGFYGSKNGQILKEYDQFVRDLIQKRLQHQEDDDEDSFVKMYSEGMQNKANTGEKTTLTEQSLYANVQTLLLGGSETTRTGTLWLLIAMAQHQEVQNRVHQELDSGLGRDCNVKWAERTKIPYTYACIVEAQRWRTVAPLFTSRMTTEDTKILGYDIPKGTSICINTWALHNDSKYWPNPEKYDPTRMLLDGGKQINFKPESYNSFSFGRRSCPGETIAMMEILVFFTKIMQKFKVMPEEGATVKHDIFMGLTYQPINFKLRFLPRD